MDVPGKSVVSARTGHVVPWLLAALPLLAAPAAPALTHRGELAPIAFSVYAPDWTWQNRDVNILVVLENGGSRPEEVTVGLALPQGKEDHFRYDGPGRFTLTVPAGGTARGAFTNINALAGVPRQTYELQLAFEADARSAVVEYPLRTIRGQAFSGGRLVALVVPAGVALVWCVAFALVLTRMARAGAWKTPGAPVNEPGVNKEPWIDRQPT